MTGKSVLHDTSDLCMSPTSCAASASAPPTHDQSEQPLFASANECHCIFNMIPQCAHFRIAPCLALGPCPHRGYRPVGGMTERGQQFQDWGKKTESTGPEMFISADFLEEGKSLHVV